MTTEALSIDALREAVARLPDDPLAAVRRQALEKLGSRGLPTPRHEDWKYTDLRPIVEISNRWLHQQGPEPDTAAAAAVLDELRAAVDADWLVIANGTIASDSLAAFRSAGVTVSPLSASGMTLDSELPLTWLNTALLRDGLKIRIGENARPDRPIGLLLFDDPAATAGVSQVRIDIEIAPNAAAQFIEYHASRGEAPHYANAVIDLALAAGGRADYVRVQRRARAHSQTARLGVRLARDAVFNHCGFDLGGALVRNDLAISIDGPGAAAAFDGLYLGGHGQHIDNHTRVDHCVGPAESRQEYRGIIARDSRCVWNGKAVVHAGADGTDAAQANHNLLLSADAEVDAKPELEIYADDVKCSHGTTVGQLDETSLYYLRTRGLDKLFAQQVLTRAFAQAIVDRSPVAAVEATLHTMIDDRLESLLGGLEP